MSEARLQSDMVTRHPFNREFHWQAAPSAPRFLTPEQAAEFDANGFVKLKAAISPAELAAVEAAIAPFDAASEEAVRTQGDGRIALSNSGTINFSVHLVRHSEVLRQFARHPAITAVCRDLMGPRVRLYWDQSVYKKAEKPREFPWHQDNGYTFVEPQQYLTFWIPLVDVDEQNGCPWIAPGYHKLGTLAHWPTKYGLKCLEDAEKAVAVPAKAGDLIVFSSLAPHRTGPNLKAGTVRKAYILQYAHDGATALKEDGTRTSLDDPERQFLVTG
ncbi:MAG: phytanoyl-CoA dioxygenase family protein [Alphaproteobacteria bacterium]|nr:phytanoyl-CoA dioxygenase family protein [Alphaproteobacteria bacterium]